MKELFLTVLEESKTISLSQAHTSGKSQDNVICQPMLILVLSPILLKF
jgi:hypothetical protein